MAARAVLVADDDPAIVRLIGRLLADEFSVIPATDGDEAVAAALDRRPSVVLLDLHMPRLDGHATLLRMRSEPVLRTTPVLIVTGAAPSGDDAAMCLRDGAHDFIRKPFDETELIARVRAAHRHKAFEDSLRLRNRELEAFASAAAHDLQEPLAGIARLVDLLQNVRLDEPTQLRLQHDIALLAEQGNHLVADLLALAREDWTLSALEERVDAEHVVRLVIDEAHLAEAQVTVTGTWAKLVVPEVVLHSVMANLISNAGHYGRSGDGVLRLTVTAAVPADRLEITVADRGPGLHPDVVRRMFEPFATAPDSVERNPLSSGLGLAVAARTVERYGGGLEFLASEGPGTAFVVSLPLTES